MLLLDNFMPQLYCIAVCCDSWMPQAIVMPQNFVSLKHWSHPYSLGVVEGGWHSSLENVCHRPALWVEKQLDTSWEPPLGFLFLSLFPQTHYDPCRHRARSPRGQGNCSMEHQDDWETVLWNAMAMWGHQGRETNSKSREMACFSKTVGSTVASVVLTITRHGLMGKTLL